MLEYDTGVLSAVGPVIRSSLTSQIQAKQAGMKACFTKDSHLVIAILTSCYDFQESVKPLLTLESWRVGGEEHKGKRSCVRVDLDYLGPLDRAHRKRFLQPH
jgi:hypothetical protein